MSSTQGRKGNAFEASVVAYLREHGFPRAERTLAGARDDRGDISNLPIILQCKNHNRHQIAEWIDQAKEQAENAGVVGHAVVFKRRGVTDPGEQYALLPLWLLAELLGDA